MGIKTIIYQLVSLFLGKKTVRQFGVFTQLAQQVADLLKKDYKEKAREYLVKATIFVTSLFIGLFALMNSIKSGEDLIRPLPNGPLILFLGYLTLTLIAFGGIFFLLKKQNSSEHTGDSDSFKSHESFRQQSGSSNSYKKNDSYSAGGEFASVAASFVEGFSSGMKKKASMSSSETTSTKSANSQNT